jgi:hypothetical protein
MAKTTTAKAPKKVKKVAKAVKAVAKAAAPKADKKKKAGKKTKGAADTLWKLAEHPLVGELLAIGATAAVAAIAEAGIDKGKKRIASKSVKDAGKAAAAAIGARLISEFADVKKPSKAKSAKS